MDLACRQFSGGQVTRAFITEAFSVGGESDWQSVLHVYGLQVRIRVRSHIFEGINILAYQIKMPYFDTWLESLLHVLSSILTQARLTTGLVSNLVTSLLCLIFCLFDLILYVHSTIVQLCGTVLPGFNQY